MESSNSTLASQVNGTMTRTAKELTLLSSKENTSPYAIPQVLPGWMKWTIVVSVIIITMACISNTIYNIWFSDDYKYAVTETADVMEDIDSTIVAPVGSDSVQLQHAQKPVAAPNANQTQQ